jgi:hypothetical protein
VPLEVDGIVLFNALDGRRPWSATPCPVRGELRFPDQGPPAASSNAGSALRSGVYRSTDRENRVADAAGRSVVAPARHLGVPVKR